MTELFIVERPNGSEWVAGLDVTEQPLWDAHAAFMDRLFSEDHIVLGGRLADESGAVLVMHAQSEDHVRELLALDPWPTERDVLRVGEIRRWRIRLDAANRTGTVPP